MGTLLTRSWPAATLAAVVGCGVGVAQRATATSSTSTLPPVTSRPRRTCARGPEGGFSKLRYAEDGFEAFRLFGEYHGRITPTLRARVVVDYVDDASDGLGVTEAAIDWRPIPRSRNQHQLRFGAFYPSFSLENGDRGWQSPFTYSYSAINTWLGEEIRPIGAEWSVRRRFEGFRSNHEVRAFAAGFYGNDPAGTLLFWRGWSLHDRQSRLGDDLEIPPRPFSDEAAAAVAVSGDRPSSRRLRRRRVALRAPGAGPARALRQSRRSLLVLGRPVGLGHRLQAPRGAGQPARGARSHRAMDGRRDGVAHGCAAERHPDADVGVRPGPIRVSLRLADAQARCGAARWRCVMTPSRPSGLPPCPCSTATTATRGRSAIASSRRNDSAAVSSGCASTRAGTFGLCTTPRRRRKRKLRFGCSFPTASPRPRARRFTGFDSRIGLSGCCYRAPAGQTILSIGAAGVGAPRSRARDRSWAESRLCPKGRCACRTLN